MAYGGFEIMYENLIASNECKKKSLSPNVHNVRLHSYEQPPCFYHYFIPFVIYIKLQHGFVNTDTSERINQFSKLACFFLISIF
jgi:hypothetical protein